MKKECNCGTLKKCVKAEMIIPDKPFILPAFKQINFYKCFECNEEYYFNSNDLKQQPKQAKEQ